MKAARKAMQEQMEAPGEFIESYVVAKPINLQVVSQACLSYFVSHARKI